MNTIFKKASIKELTQQNVYIAPSQTNTTLIITAKPCRKIQRVVQQRAQSL